LNPLNSPNLIPRINKKMTFFRVIQNAKSRVEKLQVNIEEHMKVIDKRHLVEIIVCVE